MVRFISLRSALFLLIVMVSVGCGRGATNNLENSRPSDKRHVSAKAADQEKLNELSNLITKDLADTKVEAWLPQWEALHEQIKANKRPLAHGTRSEFLASILEHGLGDPARKPKDSTDMPRNFFTDLKKDSLDAELLGAYFFAIRDTASKDLSVDATPITKRETFDRYIDANPELVKKAGDRGRLRFGLNFSAQRYLKRRAVSTGFPVLLIYEGAAIKLQAGKIDVFTNDTVDKEKLRLVLAPASQVAATIKIIEGQKINVPVYPIELFELEEIRIHRNK